MNSDFLNVRRISYNIASFMAKEQNQNHAERYIYYYSLQVIIGSLLEICLILAISWLFNMVYESIICIVVFASVRFFSGGYHADTYFKCFLLTNSLIICMAIISKLVADYYSIWINILLFTIALYFTYKYAPCDTLNKPIISQAHKKGLLVKALTLNIFLFMLSTYLLITNSRFHFVSVIGLAAFIESITITPWIANQSPLRKKNLCTGSCA